MDPGKKAGPTNRCPNQADMCKASAACRPPTSSVVQRDADLPGAFQEHHIARIQLAPPPILRLPVDARRLPRQVLLRFAARLHLSYRLQELPQRDVFALDG